MTYRKTFVIFNPFAGAFKRRRREHWLHESMTELRRAGMEVTAVPTTGPETAASIARQCILQGAELVLAAGGDGTINEVMNGMVHTKVPLGILPAGTANVLATELGIGSHMVKVARKLPTYIPERIAVGEIRHGSEGRRRYFLLMAGIGLDADIVYHLSASRKAALGKIAYWIGGFSQLGRKFPEFTVKANGKSYRASFALASRVRNYGGDLEIAPSISMLEDDIELVLFEGESSFAYLKYMLGVMTKRLDRVQGVKILRTRKLACMAPEDGRIYIQVDGEYAGRLPLEIDAVPQALTFLIPPGFRARRPLALAEQAWTTSPTR